MELAENSVHAIILKVNKLHDENKFNLASDTLLEAVEKDLQTHNFTDLNGILGDLIYTWMPETNDTRSLARTHNVLALTVPVVTELSQWGPLLNIYELAIEHHYGTISKFNGQIIKNFRKVLRPNESPIFAWFKSMFIGI